MGSSSSSLTKCCDERTREAFQFILNQSIPGHGKIFEKVSEEDMKPGDIVLFPKGSSGGALSSIFKHAAVYWKDGEIIHLQKNRKNQVRILKEGFDAVKQKGEKIQIYRKKGGIDPRELKKKVKDAMNCVANYDFCKNNCIHFALSLLGLLNFHMDLVKTPDEDSNKSVVKSKNGRKGKKRKKCIVM